MVAAPAPGPGAAGATGPAGANPSSASRSRRALASAETCIAVACVTSPSAVCCLFVSWMADAPVYTVVAPSTRARTHNRLDQSRRGRSAINGGLEGIVELLHAGRDKRQ